MGALKDTGAETRRMGENQVSREKCRSKQVQSQKALQATLVTHSIHSMPDGLLVLGVGAEDSWVTKTYLV